MLLLKGLAWLHWLLFKLLTLVGAGLAKLAWWLGVDVFLASVVRLLRTVWAMLHLLVQVWATIAVWGVVTVVGAQFAIKLSQPGSMWRMAALLACLFWLAAFTSAVGYSLRYLSLRRVRERALVVGTYQGVQEVKELVKRPRELTAKVADAARGTPMEGAFRVNRDRNRQAEAIEQRATDEQAARERQIEEWNAEHNPYEEGGAA